MKRFIGACFLLLITSACQQPPRQVVNLTASLSENDMAWSKAAGNNTVTGFAVMRTAGGEPRTCAASDVTLIPDTAYARERIQALYGSIDKGYNFLNNPVFVPDLPLYYSTIKNSTCDGQGNFIFEQIPDGSWFVVTSVIWIVANQRQGGTLMQRFQVQGSETKRIALSP
jgi:hypothetical protein